MVIPSGFIYVNGQFLPAAEAVIPVTDRGFRLGDGLFETIRLVEGRPYQWAFHRQRLLEGCEALQFRLLPQDIPASLPDVIAELAEKNKAPNGMVRLTLSRGSGSQGYLPTYATPPVWVIEAYNAAPPPASAGLWLSRWRRTPPDCLPSHLKLTQGANSMLARMEALANGHYEALMLSTSEQLAEAASANLFWVKDRIIHTPSLATGALSGSTRHALMRLLPVQETDAPLESLQNAEAVCITNAHCGVLPVTALAPMGWSWPANHPTLHRMRDALARDREAA